MALSGQRRAAGGSWELRGLAWRASFHSPEGSAVPQQPHILPGSPCRFRDAPVPSPAVLALLEFRFLASAAPRREARRSLEDAGVEAQVTQAGRAAAEGLPAAVAPAGLAGVHAWRPRREELCAKALRPSRPWQGFSRSAPAGAAPRGAVAEGTAAGAALRASRLCARTGAGSDACSG